MAALLGFGLVAMDADAASRRLGGGSNVGTQRQTITQPAPKAPAMFKSSAKAPANSASTGCERSTGTGWA